MFFLKNINFTLGVSYFSALVGLWVASGALGPPPGDLFWISLVASLVLEALWGRFWVHLCPFWSAFTAFRHPMGSYFLNFKHNSDLTQRCIIKFTFVFSILLFMWPCVLIRNLTGRISRRQYLHVIGRETGNGYSRHFVELKIPPPKGGRNMFTSERLHSEFKHDGVRMK